MYFKETVKMYSAGERVTSSTPVPIHVGPIPTAYHKMYPKVGKSEKMVNGKPSSLRETVRPTSLMCKRKIHRPGERTGK